MKYLKLICLSFFYCSSQDKSLKPKTLYIKTQNLLMALGDCIHASFSDSTKLWFKLAHSLHFSCTLNVVYCYTAIIQRLNCDNSRAITKLKYTKPTLCFILRNIDSMHFLTFVSFLLLHKG